MAKFKLKKKLRLIKDVLAYDIPMMFSVYILRCILRLPLHVAMSQCGGYGVLYVSGCL